MGIRYTHQAITTEQEIDILKERGLLIDDVEQAIEMLDTISYFRLAVLRNCCAHHSRLSNRVFPVKPMMPERMPHTWIADFSFREQTLYPQLCYVVYWLNSISASNTFVADFKQLLAKHPSVNASLLGFPRNWKQEPLWKE